MRRIVYILFWVWLSATSVVLLTPAETVRQTNAIVQSQPAVKAHRKTVAFKTVNDGGNWHLFWFFGLACLAALIPPHPSLRTGIRTAVILSVYGLMMELIQETLIPGRTFEWQDLGMNGLGIGTGLLGATAVRLIGRRSFSEG